MPMPPVPPENIQKHLENMKKYLELKKKLEPSFQQNFQELFSQANLDQVLKPSTLKQYRDETMANLDFEKFFDKTNIAAAADPINNAELIENAVQQDTKQVGRQTKKRKRDI